MPLAGVPVPALVTGNAKPVDRRRMPARKVPTPAAGADPAAVKMLALAGNVYVVPAAGLTVAGIGTTFCIDATAALADCAVVIDIKPLPAATSATTTAARATRVPRSGAKRVMMPSRSTAPVS
jgi:hypothetical protein